VTRVLGQEQGLLVRRSGDELLILDTVNDRIHKLNETAAFIWDRLAEGLSDADIAGQLIAEFDVDNEVADSDLSAALKQFRALGFIA